MATTRTLDLHRPRGHARVMTTDTEYVVQLDVADFTIGELDIEANGPFVTVRGEQHDSDADRGVPFRLSEHLEERFRLPDDVALESVTASFQHGVLEVRATRSPLRNRYIPIVRRHGASIDPDATGV